MRKKLGMYQMERREFHLIPMQQLLLDCTLPSRMHRMLVSEKEVSIDRWATPGRSRNGQRRRAGKKPHS